MTRRPVRLDGGPSAVFDRVVVPVASPEDARTTATGLARYLPPGASVLVVNVVEKAGGAPDKASVEQLQARAREAFDAFREAFGDGDVETEIRYGTDVADAVFSAADDADATAIAFTPRGGSRWVRLLTGDVALDLVTETDRPVLVLPDTDAAE
ncbi:MAG: universal stress protein [Halobacteriales archaeon]